MKLILASTSPYRRQQMSRLGLPFQAAAPRFVEAAPGPNSDAARLVVGNALGKALSLLAEYPGHLVIGSDQVVRCEGRILTKPGSPRVAVEQLLALAGREHELLTGVAVVRASSAPGKQAQTTPESLEDVPGSSTLVVNRLRMRAISRDEAETYVRLEQPLDCAGAYKSEALGIALFEYLRGDDPTAIIGLPLIALLRLLRGFGVDPLNPSADRPADRTS